LAGKGEGRPALNSRQKREIGSHDWPRGFFSVEKPRRAFLQFSQALSSVGGTRKQVRRKGKETPRIFGSVGRRKMMPRGQRKKRLFRDYATKRWKSVSEKKKRLLTGETAKGVRRKDRKKDFLTIHKAGQLREGGGKLDRDKASMFREKEKRVYTGASKERLTHS